MNLHTRKFLLLLLLIVITLANLSLTSAATSLQELHKSHHHHRHHHHKHRHKHQMLTINSNQIHDIREAFAEYRSTVNRDKASFEEIQPLRHHQRHNQHPHRTSGEEETVPATHQHQHADSSHVMFRHKRLPGSARHSTTSTTPATDEYDYNDDDEADAANRRVSDDAHVQQHDQLAEGESLTSFKYNSLGTREGVQKSFQEMQRSQQDIHSLINQNIRRTRIDGLCRWPNKKVIEMPQHPSKVYTPRKYVVHQCSDDTSCCGSASRTCIAKNSTSLTYWFHVRFANRTETVESRVVRNHTECMCVNKAPSTTRTTTTTTSPLSMRPSRTTTQCFCPETYEVVFTNNMNCACKCERSGAECRLKYEGREGFTMSDQRCILTRRCTRPQCLHGVYDTSEGRCPEKILKHQAHFSR